MNFMTDQIANKILVVDDDNDILDFMMDLLQDEISVSFASSGVKALELAKLHKPDLILLDVMMPEMDGFEVCRRLKADPAVAHIPVVFLTAKNDQDGIAKGLKLGAIDYIVKPFDPDLVATKIQNFLKQIAATRGAAKPVTATPGTMGPVVNRREDAAPVVDRRAAAPGPTVDRRAQGPARPDRFPDQNANDAFLERRAQGAARPDRFPKGGPRQGGLSLMHALIIAVVIAVAGGGGYAWYTHSMVPDGNTDTAAKSNTNLGLTEKDIQDVIAESYDRSSDPRTSNMPGGEPSSLTSKDIADQMQSNTIMSTTASCGELPKVEWWGNASHASIIAYVNTKAGGDWENYIAKWERQLTKLRGIYARGGSVIAPKVGTRLSGPLLSKYVSQVEKRVQITRCIAEKILTQ